MKLTEEEKRDHKLLVGEIERWNNLLVSSSDKYCKELKTKYIHISVLKEFQRQILKSLKESLEV